MLIILMTLFLTNIVPSHAADEDEFFTYQWALKNNGNPFTERVSDIDFLTLPGKEGEDINLPLDRPFRFSRNVIVAIIDSGVDIEHPQLMDSILKSESECQALAAYQQCLKENSIHFCHNQWGDTDTDHNGYILDCHGYNFAHLALKGRERIGNHIIKDGVGHGTHIAGIIAAKIDPQGTRGVSDQIKILPVQIQAAPGAEPNSLALSGETEIFVHAIEYALKKQVDIINISIGWKLVNDSLAIREVIKKAIDRGVLIVAAAGNGHHYGPSFPCSYEHVICVGSHGPDGKKDIYTNYGTSVDLYAPGRHILSTYPQDLNARRFTQIPGYEYYTGSSQAAPYVSGALALLLAQGNSANEARIKLLKGTRDHLSHVNYSKRGNLDIQGALNTASSSLIYPLNKNAALIQWNKQEKSTRLSFYNYGGDISDVTIELENARNLIGEEIEFTPQQIHIANWPSQTKKSFRINLNISSEEISADFFTSVKIDSSRGTYQYPLFLKAITVVTKQLAQESSEMEIKTIQNYNPHLKAFNFAPIENLLNESAHDDFLVYQQINDQIIMGILKGSSQGYHLGELRRVPLQNATLANASFLDIDDDSQGEYIISFIEQVREEDKVSHITRFTLFNQQLRPIRKLIAPQNRFDNKTTYMPLKFRWAEYQGRMVPAWINNGKRPSHQVPAATAWGPPFNNISRPRLYFLLPSGLHSSELFFDNQLSAISILNQSRDEKKAGNFYFLASRGEGHYQEHWLYQYKKNRTKKIQKINLSPYVSLLGLRPLRCWEEKDCFYFSTPSSQGDMRIIKLYKRAKRYRTSQTVVPNTQGIQVPIQNILALAGNQVLYQDRFHIGHYQLRTQQTHLFASKVNASAFNYKRLNLSKVLALNAADSPAGINETLILHPNGSNEKKLIRSARYNLLAAKNCRLIGARDGIEQSFYDFFCSDEGALIHYPITP